MQVKTIREAGGPDVKVMLDAWSSWDVPYTLRMAKLMEEYDPHWFEEPVLSGLFCSLSKNKCLTT